MQTIELKTFKVSDAFDAIKENGFEHMRGDWYHRAYLDSSGKPSLTGGCVLMQGALNLSVAPNNGSEWIRVEDSVASLELQEQGIDVWTLRDNYNLLTQLNQFEVDSTNKWYTRLAMAVCGDTIIHWNDKMDYVDTNKIDDYGNPKYIAESYLKTYADVIEMVREILAPHMDKEIQLAVVDYSVWNPVKVEAN